ncbi:MAG: class I SAM-dependent methyltransferase [Chloroflexaceae bacterium]
METSEYTTLASVELRHWWHRGMRAISAALLDPQYTGWPGLRILDAGCGTGGDGVFLGRYGQVIGVDYSAEATARACQRMPGRIGRASVLALPFADDSFDLVTSFDVLYHQRVPDEATALAEVRRVLRPGAHFLLRLPAYDWLRSRHDRQVHTRRRYTAGQVRAMLTDAGFAVERCTYGLSLLFPLSLVTRLLERFTPDQSGTSAMVLPAAPINEALHSIMALEAAWIAAGRSFPFGLSVIALARNARSFTSRPKASAAAHPPSVEVS